MGSPPERAGTAIAFNAGGGLLASSRGGLSANRPHGHHPASGGSTAPSRRRRRGGTKVPLLGMAELAAGQDDALRGQDRYAVAFFLFRPACLPDRLQAKPSRNRGNTSR